MKISKLLIVFSLLLLLAVAACRFEQPAVVSLSASDAFIVRPQGAAGVTHVYDVHSGEAVVNLPPGRVTADEQSHVSVTTAKGSSQIDLYDVLSGELTSQLTVDGEWQLAAVAPAGRWLVLQQASTNRTHFQIVDRRSDLVVHTIHLAGRFVAEAIADSGDALYLIEHIDDTRYAVRLYDLRVDELADAPLRDKRLSDEFMTGYAWGTLQSTDGAWLLTLYLNSTRNIAFIHALNLNTSTTFCLELPSGDGDFAKLAGYSLAMAGSAIYAFNAELGVLSTFDLADLDDAATIRFPPVAVVDDSHAVSAVSPDGRRLAFAHGDLLWHYAPASGSLSEPQQQAAIIDDLAYATAGDQLYLAHQELNPAVAVLALPVESAAAATR